MTPPLTRALPALLLALAAGTPAAAQTGGSLQACRTLTDAAARLACYDALPLPATTPPPAGSPPAAAGATAPRPAAAATPAANAAANPTANFGLESKAAQSAPDAVDSHIEGRFEGWGPKSRIRLANGQVWQVTDDSRGVIDLNNPKARVRRGVFGAFYLEIEGINRSPRVRRVE